MTVLAKIAAATATTKKTKTKAPAKSAAKAKAKTTPQSISPATGAAKVLPADWIEVFLNSIGAPLNAANESLLAGWFAEEHGGGRTNPHGYTGGGYGGEFNPLDTTLSGYKGATNLSGNSAGVKNYPTWQEGLAANISTIEEPAYSSLLDELRGGKSSLAQLTAAANASPWDGTNHKWLSANFSNWYAVPGGVNLRAQIAEEVATGSRGLAGEGPYSTTLSDSAKYLTAQVGSGPGSAPTSTKVSPELGTSAAGGVNESTISSALGKIDSGIANTTTGWLSGLESFLSTAGLVVLGIVFVLVGLVVIAHGSGADVGGTAKKLVGAAA